MALPRLVVATALTVFGRGLRALSTTVASCWNARHQTDAEAASLSTLVRGTPLTDEERNQLLAVLARSSMHAASWRARCGSALMRAAHPWR